MAERCSLHRAAGQTAGLGRSVRGRGAGERASEGSDWSAERPTGESAAGEEAGL